MFTKSLADTSVQYLVMQARRWEDGLLHVQIAGEEINRPYGAAFTVTVSNEILDYIEDKASIKTHSLGGSGKEYKVIHGKLLSNGRLHLQIPGAPLNRKYGATFDIDAPLDIAPLFEIDDVEDEDEVPF